MEELERTFEFLYCSSPTPTPNPESNFDRTVLLYDAPYSLITVPMTLNYFLG